MNKADKIIEVSKWMSKQGYDRRFTKDVAPVIVDFISVDILNDFADVVSSFEPTDDNIYEAYNWFTNNGSRNMSESEFKEAVRFLIAEDIKAQH